MERGVQVHRDLDSTGGISNKVVDILESKYLIRREWRSGAIWYELTHDRLIGPISHSNAEAKATHEKERLKALAEREEKMRNKYLKLKLITISAVIFVALSVVFIIGYHYHWFIQPSIAYEDACAKGAVFQIGRSPNAVAVDPSTNVVYIANSASNTVSVINCNVPRGQNFMPNTVTVGGFPMGVAVNPSTHMIYVTSRDYNTISVIDGKTNTVIKYVQVGVSPVQVVVNPNTDMIYVANKDGNTISVIDGKTNRLNNTVPVGKSPVNIAVDQDTNMIYVANKGDNMVSVINGKLWEKHSLGIGVDSLPMNHIKNVKVGTGPDGIAVDPYTNMIYVANYGDNTMSVIDGKTNSVVKTVTVGIQPKGVAVDSKSSRIYVTLSGSRDVSVIDGTKDSLLKTITVGKRKKYVG